MKRPLRTLTLLALLPLTACSTSSRPDSERTRPGAEVEDVQGSNPESSVTSSGPLVVGMGDSFAAGVGSDGFPTDLCGRTKGAWTALVAESLGMDFLNLACSAASLQDVREQAELIPSSVELVLLTAGGIDAKAYPFLISCIDTPCDAELPGMLDSLEAMRPNMREVLQLLASNNRKVLLSGYPPVFPPCRAFDARALENIAIAYGASRRMLGEVTADLRAEGFDVTLLEHPLFDETVPCEHLNVLYPDVDSLLRLHPTAEGYKVMAQEALAYLASAS